MISNELSIRLATVVDHSNRVTKQRGKMVADCRWNRGEVGTSRSSWAVPRPMLMKTVMEGIGGSSTMTIDGVLDGFPIGDGAWLD